MKKNECKNETKIKLIKNEKNECAKNTTKNTSVKKMEQKIK